MKGNFAYAVALPLGPTEGARIYLKKINGHWVVTDYGSGAVPPDDYPQ